MNLIRLQMILVQGGTNADVICTKQNSLQETTIYFTFNIRDEKRDTISQGLFDAREQ